MAVEDLQILLLEVKPGGISLGKSGVKRFHWDKVLSKCAATTKIETPEHY